MRYKFSDLWRNCKIGVFTSYTNFLLFSLFVQLLVSVQDVADIAEWDDEQIEYIKEKVTEEGKQEDIKKGKAPAQVDYMQFNYK